MSKKFFLIIVLGFGLVFFFGCGQQQVKEIDKVCSPALTREKAVNICEDVLRDLNFTIAKVDANAGLVITRPLQAGQFFEFWRKDNVGASNAAEANLHSIRRIVELNINESDSQLCLSCKATVQRLSLSEPAENQMGIEYDRLNSRRIRTTALKLELDATRKQWLDLGNDEKLAAVILRKIESRELRQ
jgi:hypothetical protein